MKTQALAGRTAAWLAAAVLGCAATAAAQAGQTGSCASCAGSNASTRIGEASGLIGMGIGSVIGGSGLLVVESVTAAGEGSVVVLKGASNGVTASVRVSADVARQLSGAVGASVQAVAMSTGTMLVVSGKAIAFIPNEIGLALLHQSKLD
jgi:hypothetical protein